MQFGFVALRIIWVEEAQERIEDVIEEEMPLSEEVITTESKEK